LSLSVLVHRESLLIETHNPFAPAVQHGGVKDNEPRFSPERRSLTRRERGLQ
jgi:hypothetical protein